MITEFNAADLIGKKVIWKTPNQRRVAPGEFVNTREGIVIGEVPPGVSPVINSEVATAKPSQCQFGGGKYGESINHRIVVRVEEIGRSGKPLQPMYFAPRLSSVIEVLE